MRRPMFAANWKMNLGIRDIAPFFESFFAQPGMRSVTETADVVFAPPATHLIPLMQKLSGTTVAAAGQNCGTASSGAFTGEISPAVLTEIGCRYVILGHSERRHVYFESNALIFERLKAALTSGLSVVLCVGEQLAERKTGKTLSIIEDQLSLLWHEQFRREWDAKLIVAYEPVWAIGTGETATPGQAQEVHQYIRKLITDKVGSGFGQSLRILYGGSVKPAGAAELFEEDDVDGFLVGGASLEPVSFANIIRNSLESSSSKEKL